MNQNKRKRPRVLFVATTASMIEQFNMENIRLLQSMGYEVHVVCNFSSGNTISDAEVADFHYRLVREGIRVFGMPLQRPPFAYGRNMLSCLQLHWLIKKYRYEIIHCHTPMGSMVARFAARSVRGWHGRIVYTAHGFHFYSGAPLLNWLLFFPAEWLCSFITDTIITINTEDYAFARKHLHARKIDYVPGVGIDTSRFAISAKQTDRTELGLHEGDIALLSVGELNRNKNHEVVIRALARLKNPRIHYIVCGIGSRQAYLEKLITQLGLENNVHLIGYRNDVERMYSLTDIYVFPSFREGLSVALMEAMASGMPVICSDIRGNNDLIDNGEGGKRIDPHKDAEWAKAIAEMVGDNAHWATMGKYNHEKIERKFSIKIVMNKMEEIYSAAMERQ